MRASGGHVECVKVLLDNGAKVNMQNKVSADYLVTKNQCVMSFMDNPICVFEIRY